MEKNGKVLRRLLEVYPGRVDTGLPPSPLSRNMVGRNVNRGSGSSNRIVQEVVFNFKESPKPSDQVSKIVKTVSEGETDKPIFSRNLEKEVLITMGILAPVVIGIAWLLGN